MSLRARHRLLPLIPAALFLAFGLSTLSDYAMTWDEAESWNAAASNLEMLRGTGVPWEATHVIPGYYFALDTLRALFLEGVAVVVSASDPSDQILAHHAFNLLLASASLALLSALVLQISGRPRMALYAGCSLALMPPFIGHALNNPKDLPALFVFLLATSCVVRLVAVESGDSNTRAWRWWAAAALSLGLALTTRVLSASLLPILGGWILWRRRTAFAALPLHWIGLAVASGATAVALWPWLWDAPIAKIGDVLNRISIHELVDFQIVYLGELVSWREMPWHYRPVHFLVALPLVHLGLAALSAGAAFRWRADRDSRFDVIALAMAWLGVLALVDQVAPYRYDGIRHFLPALPAIAMLVAAGSEWLSDLLSQRFSDLPSPLGRALLAGAPVGLCAVVVAAQIAWTHPYQSAYMNAAANAIAGPHSEEWIEVEYWGQAYAEGGRWINANTEPDALVYLPVGEKVAGYYTRRRRGAWKHFDAQFGSSERPQYVMFITRQGFYDAKLRRLEAEYEPVYTIEVQNATLLKIYSNRQALGDRRGERAGRVEPTHG